MPLNQSDFDDLRQMAQTSRESLATTVQALNAENVILHQIERDIALENSKVEPDPGVLSDLTQQHALSSDRISSLQNSISLTNMELRETIRRLVVYDDPRELVGRLDDKKPVFLFPVRVETRFMTVKHVTRIAPRFYAPEEEFIVVGEDAVRETQAVEMAMPSRSVLPRIDDIQQLWVRIFPDDIAVHTHEPELTEAEYEAGKTYWTEMWYAGGDAKLEIGAWRGLTGGLEPQRAAWVARQTEPTNPGDKPSSPVDPQLTLNPPPNFATPALKDGPWTEAPHSKVMPDCFVIRLYQGSSYREVIGNPVPDPLYLSIDPNDDEDAYDFESGKFDLPDKIKWLTDMDEAVRVGMAMKIDLQGNEATAGFDRVLVLGVKYSTNDSNGQLLLENLFDNHHYTSGGLSIVPQGTPTNNTEKTPAGYSAYGFGNDDLFRIEQGGPLFSPITDDRFKTDGQHLAEALGLDYGIVQNIGFADGYDIKDGMCMNRALWPTTLGYYLRQPMHPAIPTADISRTKQHFSQFVLGRGRIPAIRVDDQPYGILPVTAFSRWKEKRTDQQSIYRDRLFKNMLRRMEGIWNSLLGQVKHAGYTGSSIDPRDLFMEVLGLHATSVEYYQRFAGGPFFMWNLFNFYQVQNSANNPEVPYQGQSGFDSVFANMNFSWLSAPRIFGFGYLGEERFLNGPKVDSLPLSEKRIVEKVGNGSENYLKWLSISSYQTVLTENFSNIGAGGANPPNALLYLLLRHACLLEYIRTGLTMLVDAQVYSQETAIQSEFVNLVESTATTAEVRQLVTSFVEVELGVPREADLEAQTEAEFQYRESQGWLEGMTEEQIEAERLVYKSTLREQSQEEFNGQVLQESDARLERYQALSSETGFLNLEYPELATEGTLADHILQLVDQNAVEVAEMNELRDALSCLTTTPTARLERAMAEHIDTVNYRLDAWFYSLVAERLHYLRMGEAVRDTGIYLGAYSWLEDLRPSGNPGILVTEVDLDRPVTVVLEPAEPLPDVEPEIKATLDEPIFFRKVEDVNQIEVSEANIRDVLAVSVEALGPRYAYLGSGSSQGIVYDPASNRFVMAPQENPDNQGYIHAPSMNHATTAAVLRAGYNAHHANSASPEDALAVNLTSERVRRALHIIEGIRNGQELAALLGYQFERGLHDREEELDTFILDIRDVFPLVANRVLESTGNGSVAPVASDAEAYNVVDGLKLVEASRDPIGDFPYGVNSLNMTPITPAQQEAIKKEVIRLHDTLDATNDLLLAESVYQTVQGNHYAAGAALNALSGRSAPTTPDILSTPRKKNTLTHKMGVLFDMQGGGAQAWSNSSSPRSLAEPFLNRWLGSQLPSPSLIRIAVEYRSLSAAENDPWTVSQVMFDQLDLQPIDLFYMLSAPSQEGEAVELVSRVAYHVRKSIALTDAVAVKVLLKDKTNHLSSQFSLFELTPLILQLVRVVNDSRTLQAEDFLLSGEADEKMALNPTAGYVTSYLETRLNHVLSTGNMSNGEYGLGKVVTELTAKITPVENLDYNSLPGNESTLLENLRTALMQAAAFSPKHGIPASSIDFSEENATAMVSLAKRVKGELSARLANAGNIMGSLSGLTESKKAERLMAAAKVIFGRAFRVFPEFRYYDPVGFEASRTNGDYLDHAGELAVEEWAQGVSMVRSRVSAFRKAGLYAGALLGNVPPEFRVAQLPLTSGDNFWLGVEFPVDHEYEGDSLSLVLRYPSNYDTAAAALRSGFILDEWVEELPAKNANTGIAIHYDNPNSEPPQTCLLAVTPEITGNWSWSDLMETLNDTLDWARKRAIDPDLLNTTPLAQVLPGIMATISGNGDSPSLDFGRNIVIVPSGLSVPLHLSEYESIYDQGASS